MKWLKRKTNKPSKIKTKKAKKSSVFKPCVIKLLMTKRKIHGTFIEIHYSMTLKNGYRVKTKKKGEPAVFLGAHKGDKPLEFLSKGLYCISLLLN